MSGFRGDKVTYTIRSSEITRESGAEYETKALLYLMNFSKGSEYIYYFVVDFFNDLTGVDRYSDKLWDAQSKGAKNNSPRAVGKELVTLYKNYISEFDFNEFILFLGGVSTSLRIDSRKNVFRIDNVKEDAKKKIKQGLIEECADKSYIESEDINEKRINEFLDKVTFVIDDKSKSEYVKGIIKVNPLIIPDDNVLEQIFNTIRDAQSVKKNNAKVEGLTLSSPEEFIYYNRHLKASEIKMMVLNTLVNWNLMDKGIPHSFSDIYVKIPSHLRRSTLEDCQNDIARMLFNKNNSENFWALFNNIYDILAVDSNIHIEEAYKQIDRKILEKIDSLEMLSLKYFISIIKDGMYEN